MESMNFKFRNKKIKFDKNTIKPYKKQDNSKENSYKQRLKLLLLNIKSKVKLHIKIQLIKSLLKTKYIKVKLESKLNKNFLMQRKDTRMN